MDNICHTLIAGALAKAGLERATSRATAALVVAANLPDADIVTTPLAGPGGYLVHHRAITHSLVGVIALGPIVAAALYAYSRRRDPAGARGRFWPLCWVSWIGLASHLVLDSTNPYGVRPWLPFDGRWLYGDWVAIVDPWLWLVPGVALFWLTANDLWSRVAWGVLAMALTAPVLLSGLAPTWAMALWLAGLGVALAGARWGARRLGAKAAWAALVFVVAYWGVSAFAHRSAVRAARGWLQPDADTRLAAIPTPGDPATWRIVEYAPDSVTVAMLPLRGGSLSVLGRRPLGLDDPAAQAALATEGGRAMRVFARFPFAEVAARSDGVVVYLRDARYALEERVGWGVMPIVVPRAQAEPAAP